MRVYNRPTHTCTAGHPRAFSLLEVVVGLVVVALILIPTTSMMRDVLDGEGTQEKRSELIHLAQGKQSEYCHLSRVRFRNRSNNGTFASVGQPRLRYAVTCSQDAADGGIPGRMLAIHTVAWHDANRNRTLDSNEPSTQLWTTVSRATP